MFPQERRHAIPDGGSVIEIEVGNTESPTNAVVRGLAALQGVPEIEVGPLYDRIQTEAMNTLIRHAQQSSCYVGVEFRVEEYTIVVKSDKRVLVHNGDPITDTMEAD